MYATVHLGQALVKAVPIPGLCHGVTQPTSHHIGFSHKKTSSRCVAKASQAAPPSGMPPQNASQVLREKEVQPAEATTSGRKIVFAVDGTVDAEEGLRWLVKQVARKGDTIHLAHVITDPRTPSTAVGSSEVATQWSPNRDEAVFTREFLLRMEHQAQTMLSSRFVPSLQFTGVNHQVDLLRLKVHKSAAGIGELLSNRAVDVQADLLVIASHGAGVLADYGSVARWCSENSSVPTLLLPPSVLQTPGGMSPNSNAVVVAAVNDTNSLQEAFKFAVKTLSRPGDCVYALLVKQLPDEETGVALRKELVVTAQRWLEESDVEHVRTLQVAVDIVTEAPSDASAPPEDATSGSVGATASPAGRRLCTYAEDLCPRAFVLYHHGRSMMQDMMFGPVTLQVTKHCSRPLVVLGASAPH